MPELKLAQSGLLIIFTEVPLYLGYLNGGYAPVIIAMDMNTVADCIVLYCLYCVVLCCIV